MGSVFDATAFILRRTGEITPMKLQKLVYYGQAWSLVRDGEELFPERIEAWRKGPVCPRLYATHAGNQSVAPPYPFGDPGELTELNVVTLDAVLLAYGGKPAQWLSDLTHREDPWKNARGNLPLDASSDAVITLESMRAYYARAESQERRVVMSFGRPENELIALMQDLDDEENAILDELAEFDESPEVAKLTVS